MELNLYDSTINLILKMLLLLFMAITFIWIVVPRMIKHINKILTKEEKKWAQEIMTYVIVVTQGLHMSILTAIADYVIAEHSIGKSISEIILQNSPVV